MLSFFTWYQLSGRMIETFTPALVQALAMGAVELRRPVAVDHDVHVDASSGPLREGIAEVIGRITRPVYVS